MIAIQYSAQSQLNKNLDTGKEEAFMVYFIFMYIFMSQFLYYVLVFLIATACSFWYYGVHENYFCKGSKWLNFYHIGSLTFGAFLVTVVSIIKSIVQQESDRQMRNGNACIGICLCCLACLISQIEYLLKVLNHNAIIVMTVTGEGYIDSAKSAAGIIFQNFGLFNIVETINSIVFIGGIVLSVGIPTLAGVLIARYVYVIIPTDSELVHIGLIIFFVSIILVVFIVSVLG